MPCGTFVSFVHVGFTETLERSGDGVDGTPSLNASLAAAAPEVVQGDVQRALGEGDARAGDADGGRDHKIRPPVKISPITPSILTSAATNSIVTLDASPTTA